MTPGLYVEFVVPDELRDFDPKAYGDTVKQVPTHPNLVGNFKAWRAEVEWLEHDGDGGVYASFVGVDAETYLSDPDLPIWKVVAE